MKVQSLGRVSFLQSRNVTLGLMRAVAVHRPGVALPPEELSSAETQVNRQFRISPRPRTRLRTRQAAMRARCPAVRAWRAGG